MQPAHWLQRTTPPPRLPCSPTPFGLLFGRDVRSQIDEVTPELDSSDFLLHGGLHSFVADSREAWREVTRERDALLKRHELRLHQRSGSNSDIRRASAGTKVKKGDLVMAQEADSTLLHEGIHRQLVHEEWTGPWKVSAVVTPGCVITSSSRAGKSASGGKLRRTSSLFTSGSPGYATTSGANMPTSPGTRTEGLPLRP